MRRWGWLWLTWPGMLLAAGRCAYPALWGSWTDAPPSDEEPRGGADPSFEGVDSP